MRELISDQKRACFSATVEGEVSCIFSDRMPVVVSENAEIMRERARAADNYKYNRGRASTHRIITVRQQRHRNSRIPVQEPSSSLHITSRTAH